MLLADGFEDAYLGAATQFNSEPMAVYDLEKCVEILVAQGMDEDEAIEYLEFNVLGAWVGPQTPLFLRR